MRPRTRHPRHHLDTQGQGRALRARHRRAHGLGDRRQGRRQGGDPARRHDLPKAGSAAAARAAPWSRPPRTRSPTASRGSSRCSRPTCSTEQGVQAGEEQGGVRFAKNMCPSQGTMDIFIEPVLPRPQVVICGACPVAVAVADLARCERLRRHRLRAGRRAGELRASPTAASKAMPCRSTKKGQRYVVVSTQGRGDEAALLGGAGARRRLRRLRRQPPQGGGAEGEAGRARRRARAAGQVESAGRPRSRRHHGRTRSPFRSSRRSWRFGAARGARRAAGLTASYRFKCSCGLRTARRRSPRNPSRPNSRSGCPSARARPWC